MTTLSRARASARALAAACALAAPALALPALALPATLWSQDVAARVAATPDGEVRLAFPARPDACGDGRKVIGIGQTAFFIAPDMEGYGRMNSTDCRHGPVRVAATVRNREVVALRAHVGGAWQPGERVTDLGTVDAAQAATWLITLARTAAEPVVASAALVPAAIAAEGNVAPALLPIARDPSRPMKVRRRAVNLAGTIGDASLVPALLALAKSDERVETGGKKKADKGVAGAAVGALARLPDGAGTEALLGLLKDDDVRVRRDAVFHLGMSDDARGRRAVRAIAESTGEEEDVRSQALFALGHNDDATPEDRAWLRALWPRLTSEKLRDQLLMAAAQSETTDDRKWLVARASDAQESIRTRRQAVFWAGQGGAPIAELLGIYRGTGEAQVREHVIFALSQRGEKEATDALLDIARNDADRQMRRKALFWLGQKDDPRVAAALTDIIVKP